MNYASVLASPFKLGNKTLKNRIIMPAMGTGLASINGEVTPALLRYYEERARGGAGAIVVEISCVDSPQGRASLTQLGIDRPALIPGLAELAETIKSYDCLAMVQLHHAGRQTASLITGGLQPVAPSPKACRFMRAEPRQLSKEEITQLRIKFIKAAVTAARAGFDGVELHAAHGYLLSQFLSPYTNLRDDEYGGSLENRFRLLKEIMEGIKSQVPGLILAVRFNLSDFVKGGIELEEGLDIARLIEENGADLLDASCGIYESGQTSIETASFAEGWRMSMIAQAKQAVNIPVVGGGVIRTPEMAAQMIREGYIDLVWIGRGMLADPDWANKSLQDSSYRIRPCITCNTCFETINKGQHIRCAINPNTGREERMLRQVSHPEVTVLIAGGGPAGMQAALSFSQADSRVILVEAREQLGGQMLVAQKPPGKSPVGRLQQYLINEVKSSAIELRLSTKLTTELIEEIKPDVLVIATGSQPIIPGIENINNLYAAAEVLEHDCDWQDQQIVIIGGGSTGCEVADYLSGKNEITLVEKGQQIAADMENMSRLELLFRLKEKGVISKKMTVLESVGSHQITLRQLDSGDTTVVPYDRLIWAIGNQSNLPELNSLKLPPQVFIVGDAKLPRGFAEAFYEAQMLVYRVAKFGKPNQEQVN